MTAERTTPAQALRALPSVDALTRELADRPEIAGLSRPRLTATVRSVLDAERRRVAGGRGFHHTPPVVSKTVPASGNRRLESAAAPPYIDRAPRPEIR